MTGLIGLFGLISIFVLIFLWGIHNRRVSARFYARLEKLGFGRGAVMPEDLKAAHPDLSARSGPRGVLLLLGQNLGARVQVAGGGSVQTLNFFLGFVVPPAWAIRDVEAREQKKALRSPMSVCTLKDGSQAFVWLRVHTPKQLEKTMAALQYVIGKASFDAAPSPPPPPVPVSAPVVSAPVVSAPTQASTPRNPRRGVPQKRYYVMGRFTSNIPELTAWVGGCYHWPSKPERGELPALLGPEAKKIFASKGHPEAEPLNLSLSNPLAELPDAPFPPANDARPLKHWRIDAEMVCHDIKFGTHIDGVFGWPEEPSGGPLQSMLYVLLADTISSRGDDPSNADYSDVSDVKITPTLQALSYPE